MVVGVVIHDSECRTCSVGDLIFSYIEANICCLQLRELWFIDLSHVVQCHIYKEL